MNPATSTLSGSYATATLKMADGTEVPVLVRKVPRGDGSFGMVVVDDAAIEFEQRFANTDMVPHDHAPVDTEILTRKDPESLRAESSTRIRMLSADLIQAVGDPDRILAQGKLDDDRLAHFKAHPSSATLARRVCLAAGGKWAKVAKMIPQFYPEGR
jgi:hypothetical protein